MFGLLNIEGLEYIDPEGRCYIFASKFSLIEDKIKLLCKK